MSNREDPAATSLDTFEDDPAGEHPNSLVAAVRACKHGVARTHVIDAHVPGALLVELYSRDGLGIMVSGEAQQRLGGLRFAAHITFCAYVCLQPAVKMCLCQRQGAEVMAKAVRWQAY